MWRILSLVSAVAVVLAIGAVFTLIEIGKSQFNEPGPLTAAVFFEIPKGAVATRVASDLVEKGIIHEDGLIPSEIIFREGAKRTRRAQSIRYGTFDIPAAASMDQILDIITQPDAGNPRYLVQLTANLSGGRIQFGERQPGSSNYDELFSITLEEKLPDSYSAILSLTQSVEFRVSVPEGLTSWQIIESLKRADFLSGEVNLVPPEGSLAPDTYVVKNNTDRATLISLMQEAQTDILASEWSQRSEDIPVESPEEAIILASIIEKETSQAEERGLVASVFVNRLRKGMPLQTDPTVIYGITEGRAPLGRGLRKSELKKDTPYNTYIHPGLPPSPISNPGKLAIRAALNPDESDFIFFVANGTGGHAFATTYDEHRRNVRQWREIESSNN